MNGLEFAMFVVSGSGICLCAFLFMRTREASRIASLKRFYTHETGLSDLLNQAAVVSDGVVICKNGALLAGWEYSGEDYVSLSDSEYDSATIQLNDAIKRLGNGWVLHLDAQRAPFNPYADHPRDHFPDSVTKAIDQERRARFASGAGYRSRFIMCVTYMPPSGVVKILSEAVVEDEQEDSARDPLEDASRALERFEHELTDLENKLSSVLKLRRLGAYLRTIADEELVCDSLLEHLQYCITGKRHPVRLPDTPVYLDSIIGGQELYSGVIPRIGRNFIQVIAIDGFPLHSFSGILSTLGDQSMQYRWFTRFIFLESWESIAAIESFRLRWAQKVVPFIAQILNVRNPNFNRDAQMMVEDAEDAKVPIAAGEVSSGYYTSGVVLYGEDRDALELKARHFEQLINNLGFTARVETVNAIESWLGSIPGHAVENIRRPVINTLNLSAMIPFSSVWTGCSRCPAPEIYYPSDSPALLHCFTDESTPFDLNLHVDDVPHSFMVGPVGTGKSTALGLIAASLLRYKDMTLFCFDKGQSMYTLCTAAGGTHYTIGEDAKLQFCPLQYLATPSDRAWACDWIASIAQLNSVEITPQQRIEIGRAIESMQDTRSSTMSDLFNTLQDKELREVLHDYTVAGTQGQLFDSKSDTLALSRFTVFEVEELMNLSPKYCLPVLLYLFRRIEGRLKGQPAFILIDEAWLALAHPVFRDRIKEWLRVLRKANCGVLMATQLLSDAISSGIVDILKDSTATRIFLPNPNAGDVDQADLYSRFGLGPREISLIAAARPKCDYYIRTEAHRRMIQLSIGPLALSFIGVCDKQSLKEVKDCQKQCGSGWVNAWLGARKLVL